MSSTQPDNATPSEGPDFKAKLDDAANKLKHPAPAQETAPQTTGAAIIDKVSHYIPAVKKVVGGHEEPEERVETPPTKEIPPHRPHHDTQIGEFLREQHKSIPVGSLDE